MQVPKLADCNSQLLTSARFTMRSDKWKSRQPPGSLVVSSHSCTEGKATPPTHAASRLAHGIAPSRWPVKRWRGDGVDAELRFVHLRASKYQTAHSAPRLDAGPLGWSLRFRAFGSVLRLAA